MAEIKLENRYYTNGQVYTGEQLKEQGIRFSESPVTYGGAETLASLASEEYKKEQNRLAALKANQPSSNGQ